MLELEKIISQMTANASAIRALVETVSDEQGQWKPDPETWSIKEVMEHLYNEERIDFRMHLKEMLSDPPQAWWSTQHEGPISVANCQQALECFLKERDASIAWLQELKFMDDQVKTSVTFKSGETVVFSTGDILFSWVAHDFLHIRQVNELLYAWNEKQASPHSLEYAGEW